MENIIEKTDAIEPIKKEKGKRLIPTRTLYIIALVIILTILALCLFPESAQSLLDLAKMFLSLFSIALGGAVSAYAF